MSRYDIKLENGSLTYGYDHAVYYFFQLWEEDDENNEDPIKDYDYYTPRPNENYFGASQLYEELLPYKELIPKEHLLLIAGDLPI